MQLLQRPMPLNWHFLLWCLVRFVNYYNDSHNNCIITEQTEIHTKRVRNIYSMNDIIFPFALTVILHVHSTFRSSFRWCFADTLWTKVWLRFIHIKPKKTHAKKPIYPWKCVWFTCYLDISVDVIPFNLLQHIWLFFDNALSALSR